jgi:predicted nuclease of restriction endonuclease-like (RecB) superfamily
MKDIIANEVEFIVLIKERIKKAQYETLKTVNTDLINLYWSIGQDLSNKLKNGWGKSIIVNLANALKQEFPNMTGFSATNLNYMVQLFNEYNGNENLQPLVGEISWTKNITILSKCKEEQERQFYLIAAKKYGWTKDVLIHQIENKTFEKYLINQTNFEQTLPENIKSKALLSLKDHYTFDYLELANEHSEYELEQALIKNIKDFLLELGPDFSFIGNQYKLEVSNKEYKIDLLLFHRQLQSLIAIDLKIGEFEPEHKGKMEFYLNVLNEKIKLPHENSAIGIIICKQKNRTIVEYALSTSTLPIGVATYSISNKLPEAYLSLLPATDQIALKLNEFLNK